jgi:hypothetical protein
MTAKEIQHALTYSQNSPFFYRSHYVVPNVYWGLGFDHELDLLSINKATRIGTEIEIKVTKSDIKADLEKRHGHYDERIRQLYFAGPEELREALFEYVPEQAGIITVYKNENPEWEHLRYQCVVRRRPKRGKYTIKFEAYKFTDQEIMQLLHLGNMRYWSLFSKQFKKN